MKMEDQLMEKFKIGMTEDQLCDLVEIIMEFERGTKIKIESYQSMKLRNGLTEMETFKLQLHKRQVQDLDGLYELLLPYYNG